MTLNALGYSDKSLIGVCTGGFHAIRSACDDVELFARALAINSWLTWRAGTPLDRSAHAESMRSIYLRTPVKIRKLLTIRHRIMSIGKIALARFRARFIPERDAREALRMIRRAARRGLTLTLVTGEADRSWESLNKFGVGGRWLTSIPGVTIRRAVALDHPVISLESQQIALREIGLFLGLDESRLLELHHYPKDATEQVREFL